MVEWLTHERTNGITGYYLPICTVYSNGLSYLNIYDEKAINLSGEVVFM